MGFTTRSSRHAGDDGGLGAWTLDRERGVKDIEEVNGLLDRIDELTDEVYELRDEIRILNQEKEKLADLVEYAYRESRADHGYEFDGPGADASWRGSNSIRELQAIV